MDMATCSGPRAFDHRVCPSYTTRPSGPSMGLPGKTICFQGNIACLSMKSPLVEARPSRKGIIHAMRWSQSVDGMDFPLTTETLGSVLIMARRSLVT